MPPRVAAGHGASARAAVAGEERATQLRSGEVSRRSSRGGYCAGAAVAAQSPTRGWPTIRGASQTGDWLSRDRRWAEGHSAMAAANTEVGP